MLGIKRIEKQAGEILVIDVARDECMVEGDDAKDFVKVLNGIAWFCGHNGGYCEGYRNEIAVNLVVASTMLGLDYDQVLDKFIDKKLINPGDDDQDIYERFNKVYEYWRRFDWDYMIDPSYYVTMAQDHDYDIGPIEFTIS